MKKKSIKNLSLNKKVVSKLNDDEKSQIVGGSLWFCGTEGSGCYWNSYYPIFCNTLVTNDACLDTRDGDYCDRTVAVIE